MSFITITLVQHGARVRGIVRALRAAGFSAQSISVVFPGSPRLQPTKSIHPPDLVEANTQSGRGAVVGGICGGTIGTALAALSASGVAVFPDIGALLAALPMLSILIGTGMGAALGGLVGALIGVGMTAIDARRFASSMSDGRTLIAVRSEDDHGAQVAEEIMRRDEGEDIARFGGPAQPITMERMIQA